MRTSPFTALAALSLATACGGKSTPRASSTGPAPRATEPPRESAGGDSYGGDGYGGLGYDDDDGHDGWDDDGYGGDGYGGDGYGAWAGGPPAAPVGPTLDGRWVSTCLPGAVRGESTRLTYDFTDSAWTLTIDGFRDAACARHQVAMVAHGGYTLGAASATVTGAWELRLDVTGRELVVDDAKAATAFARHCKLGKLTAGKSADLAGGCPGWKLQPLARCAVDHDLVAIVDEQLQLGVRPADNDLCTPERRPAALQPTLALAFTVPAVGVPACDAMFQAQVAMLRCPQLPAEARAALRSAIAQTARSVTEAAKIKEAAASLSSGCTQAHEALTTALTSFGCSP